MNSAFATHTGMIRKNNEDAIRCDDELGIYLLADGIGGLNAGEVASALAIETVHSVLRSNITHTDADDFFELMLHAIQTAHWEICTRNRPDTPGSKMGTTLVAAVLRDNKAYIIHAGDSRCYLYQDGYDSGMENQPQRLVRLTSDHTFGDRLLAKGTPIHQIPRKHFHALTQSIGCGNPPAPDFSSIELEPGSLLLFCSDGLTDMLSDLEIEAILSDQTASLKTRAMALIDAANAKGGRDNISVLLVNTQSTFP